VGRAVYNKDWQFYSYKNNGAFIAPVFRRSTAILQDKPCSVHPFLPFFRVSLQKRGCRPHSPCNMAHVPTAMDGREARLRLSLQVQQK
jgi:hypothetical protein